MRLSEDTKVALKNFAAINTDVLLPQGNTIRIMDKCKTMVASYVCEEEFPVEFAIAELGRFNSALSLFESPDLEFQEDSLAVTISDDESKIRFPGVFKHLITSVEQDPEVEKPFAKFILKAEVLKNILKSSSMFNTNDIMFYNDGDKLAIKVFDKELSNDTSYEIQTKAPCIGDFNYIVKRETLNLVVGDYKAFLYARTDELPDNKNLIKFKHTVKPLTYFIGIDYESTYEE